MLRTRKHETGAISTITLIEILRGIDADKRPKAKTLLEETFNHLAIDNKVILNYCDLYDKLKKQGTLVPDADLLIAATATTHNVQLKTKDEHFKRLEKLGLKLAQTSKSNHPSTDETHPAPKLSQLAGIDKQLFEGKKPSGDIEATRKE
jgi:predicted nucleic acid-binding protein